MSLYNSFLLCAAFLTLPIVEIILVVWSVMFVALLVRFIKVAIEDWKAYKNDEYEEIDSQEEEA